MAISLLPIISLGQIKVSHVTDSLDTKAKEGIFYNLPRTRLVFEVVLVKTTKEKGPFNEYARDFLGIENIITQNAVEYNISAITVSPQSEPDPSEYYFVERFRKFPWINRQCAYLQITKEGFICSYNHFQKDGPQSDKKNVPGYFGQRPDLEKKGKPLLPLYHINDALLSAKEKAPGVDSTIRLPLRRPVFIKERKEMPLVEKARIALENLSAVRENRQNLTSGYQEVAYEKGTMELMINQLNAQEKELLEQFIGSSYEETLIANLSVLPLVPDSTNYLLGWFSKKNGLSYKPSEEAIPLKIILKPFLPPSDSLSGIKNKKVPRGLVYRSPVMTEYNLYLGDELLYNGLCTINQFGRSVLLPKQVKHAVFYPETGGIKSLK